ncbi:hypothetical protein [Actinoplanes sp. NPDC026670]
MFVLRIRLFGLRFALDLEPEPFHDDGPEDEHEPMGFTAPAGDDDEDE